MSRSLLALIDQVSGEMGLTQPTIVIGSAVNQTNQLLALAQRLGLDLIREYEWQQAVKYYPFQTTAALTQTGTTTSGSNSVTGLTDTSLFPAAAVISGNGIPAYTEILGLTSATSLLMTEPATASGTGTLTFAYQDYALPSDYDRMVADTNWDRTNHWRNLGPQSSQNWQTVQGGLISTGPRERFRIYANKMRIFPAITTVLNLGYEYVSNSWVIASGTTATKSLFTIDTDTAIFPDDLMLSGLRLYFKQAKGLDYSFELAYFNEIKSTRKAQDVPESNKSLAPMPISPLVGPWSVPEGSWTF